MTIAHDISRLIEHMMKSAQIHSPRFTDYYVAYTPILPEQMEIERSIDKTIQESLKRNRRRSKGTDPKSSGESEENEALHGYQSHVAEFYERKKMEDKFIEDALRRIGEDNDEWDLDIALRDVSGPARQGMGAVRNPAGGLETLMARLPQTALVVLAVALAPMIIDEMKRPGSFLDIRWKRVMLEEFNAFLERQDQWNTMLGLRQVIVQSQVGFLMTGGASMSENTLRIVRGGGTIADSRLANPNDSFYNHTKELFDR